MTTSDPHLQPLFQRLRSQIREFSGYVPPAPTEGIHLDANESPFEPPPAFFLELAERLQANGVRTYPDPTGTNLRDALAKRFGGAVDEYVLGCGSDENIAQVLTLFSPTTVLYPDPSFSLYPIASAMRGHTPIGVPLKSDYALDVDAFYKAIEEHDPGLIFIASPNNPTNNSFSTDDLFSIAERAPNALLVVDEAYGAYNEWRAHHEMTAKPNIAVMGTLSKIGYAGLRLGWIRFERSLARELDKVRLPYNTATASQIGAELVLTQFWEDACDTVERVIDERSRVEREVSSLGFSWTPSQSNSLLIRCENAEKAVQALQDKGVFVRRFSHPRLASHFRVTIGTVEQNNMFIEALGAA